MTTRYAVTHAFHYTFEGESAPTFITRQNADADVPRMDAKDRESMLERGYLVAYDVPDDAAADFTPPAPLVPVELTEAAPHGHRGKHSTHKRTKGGE